MRSQAQLSCSNSYLQLTLLSCLEHGQVVGPAGLLGFQVLLPQSLPEHWEGTRAVSKSRCWRREGQLGKRPSPRVRGSPSWTAGES